ncbi:MAG: ComEA family DNA-binding protein [Nocardioides sp.]
MRSRSHAAQHDAVVARRLELLTTELADLRPESSWAHLQPAVRAVPDLVLDPGDEADEGDEDTQIDGRTGPPASVVRLPGRHAARRPGPWVDLLPEAVRGRVALGPGQVAVVAVLVALGLAATCWWLVRSGGRSVSVPTALETPATGLTTPADPASSSGGGGPTGAAVEGPSPSTQVIVDVTGRVRHPGIAVLRPGARVVDALRAAGGARPGVDLGGLNLAQVLTDGQQVVVGRPAPAVPGGNAPPAGAPPAAPLVDLNTADETTLESLPEVGPVTAAAIIAWRGQHGGFTAVDQLLDVDGIGDPILT